MPRFALIILVALTFFTLALEAQTTGRLAVRIRDDQGRPLEFVNVAVYRGTQRITGAQTSDRGTANIINIPPGSYEVRCTLVGYGTVTHQDVRIVLDQATPLNVTMRRAAVDVAAIVVTGSHEAIDKGKVGSQTTINMDNMETVAVTDVSGIIAIQPGVTNIGGELHVRGGRANEINFTIDGMSVSDPVDGGSALQVDMDAISDMKVMTGGFSAEFGNAQSGMVNIVTKDGDPDYSGRIEYQTDHIFGEGRNSDVVKFSFGGPVLGYGLSNLRDRFTFFINGGGEWLDGRLKDYYVGDPMSDYTLNGVQLLENQYPVYDPYKDRDDILGIDLGNRNYNAYNINFKTKYIIDEQQKVTLAMRGDRSYNFPFSYDWRYALDHYAFDQTEQRQYVGTYDYVFNSSMNLKVKGSYYTKKSNSGPRGVDRDNYLRQVVASKFANSSVNLDQEYIDGVLAGDYGYVSIDSDNDGVYDDLYLDSSYWTYRVQGVLDPKAVTGFRAPGSIYNNFVDDETTTISGRADFEWQYSDIHLFKIGGELSRHIIKKNQLQSFLSIYLDRFQAYLDGIYNMADYDTTGHTIPSELYHVEFPEEGNPIPIYYPQDYYAAAQASSGKRDGYKSEPTQAAWYFQDKMEWEGMIVNAGLRFDYWYLGESYEVAQDDGTYKTVKFDKDKRSQMMISPRLGVSHPITDRDILRFAYNYQNQLPQMAYIFTSKTPDDANVADQTITVGNPSLEPQITVTYEVGLSHQLSDDYVLDMTAYYKNLYNYVSTQKVKKEGEEQISWYEFISEDYGSARGVDIQLEKL
ncbi:MAG: carboxypeptidase regulatory-like domain-containing protein, partial [Candidatus Cloacimonetes bacterium]|nr:carboxypeptidase regulatory-like domain-containing protein [Candidatus Cloacimonadota bacterium]